MPNWIGDLVMATPLISDVKKLYPQALLTVLVKRDLADLLNHHPDIDHVITFEKRHKLSSLLQTRKVVKHLKNKEYDLAILTTNSFSSAFWFWSSGIKNIIGYVGKNRSWLLSHKIPHLKNPSDAIHMVDKYKHLLSSLQQEPSQTVPKLFLKEDEKTGLKLFFQKENIPLENGYICINPGAAYGSAKCWPKERFNFLTQKLITETDKEILYIGPSSFQNLIHDICLDLPTKRLHNLAGKTDIRLMMTIIQESSLLITNDSGPLHVADALEVPTVAIFGSTNDLATGPYQKKGICLNKRVFCSPCYKRTCPLDFRCMLEISVDEVYAAVHKTLGSYGNQDDKTLITLLKT
ncbi:MAG: lipopolysaccharide heptosyltransferase II [Rhabdochlamydiaceae bacterium]